MAQKKEITKKITQMIEGKHNPPCANSRLGGLSNIEIGINGKGVV